jgi:hypothetical protein
MKLRVSLLLFVLFAPVAATALNFRYYVMDETKTGQLDYELVQDCSTFSDARPQLEYGTQYHIWGCSQKSFTYREELTAWHSISPADFNRLFAVLHGLDLHALHAERGTSCSFGWLELGGPRIDFNNPLGDPTRDSLDRAVMSFLGSVVPSSARQTVTTTIEGDFEPARTVTVAQILKNPARYNGKRVRITGYYHAEFEDSNLSDRRSNEITTSLWVDAQSTFAKKGDLDWPEDGRVTIDGCFMKGPGGHMGAWPGELQRVTRVISLDPPSPPPAPADQSSKR